MPNNIIMADAKGGDPYETARKIIDGTIEEYVDDKLTKIRSYAFSQCTSLHTLIAHNVTDISQNAFNGTTQLNTLAFPSLMARESGIFQRALGLIALDLGSTFNFLYGSATGNCVALKTLILRSTSVVVLGANGSTFVGTPFASGGSGGTIYIPKSLYDHLGDGTELDYKADSVWATYFGYGTITFAQIEGSIYETQYADGTPIQTGG